MFPAWATHGFRLHNVGSRFIIHIVGPWVAHDGSPTGLWCWPMGRPSDAHGSRMSHPRVAHEYVVLSITHKVVEPVRTSPTGHL